MSLRERLRTKKEAKAVKKAAIEAGEFQISIAKVTAAIAKMKNPSDLGNIIKEFAKFLNTLEAQDAKIVFSGNFDLGQRTLLNCVLSNFLEDGKQAKDLKDHKPSLDEPEKAAPKMIKKRKSVKERLAEKEALQD